MYIQKKFSRISILKLMFLRKTKNILKLLIIVAIKLLKKYRLFWWIADDRLITQYYASTKEYIDKINVNESTYKKVHSAHLITNTKPNTIETEIHWQFYKYSQCLIPESFVVNIPNGRVWGSRGIIITPESALLHELSCTYNESAHMNPVFYKILPKLIVKNEVIAVLASPSGDNFYHWLFDILPRLALLNKYSYNIDIYYMNYSNLPFQKESLQILDININKIIPSSNDLYLQATQLIVPSLPRPRNSENIPKWTCDFLRNSFLLEPIKNNKKRIYVSRKNTRRISNETELLQLLSKYGFIEVDLEQLSFNEQITVFASAEIIIAPHGAGLANLVFCSQGTKVVEIFSPNYIFLHYFALCNRIKLNYYYMIGDGARPCRYTAPTLQAEDITVNINQMTAILNIL